MSENLSIRDDFRENRLFLNRIIASVAVMLLAVVALVVRLVYLQIAGHEQYASLSRENQIKIAPLPPNRGMIYDRNGEPLADNVVTFNLEIVPEQVEDWPRLLEQLTEALDLSPSELRQFHAQRAMRKPFESVPLRLGLSEEQAARVAVRLPWLSGAEIHTRMMRTYPYRELTAHVVGYIARINDKELASLDPAQYRGSFFIGKSGLEKSYETLLHGLTGHEEYEANVRGRMVRRLGRHEPVSGTDLFLSLDIRLQQTAMDALGEYHGAVVAIDPRNGDVLALASKPSYDPDPFIQGISRERYAALQQDEARPLYDRATRGTYLLAAFLPEPHRGASEQLLRRYVDVRLGFYGAGYDSDRIASAEQAATAIQQQLWNHAVAAGKLSDSPLTANFVNSLSRIIDLDTTRLAAMRNRIPLTVWVLLLGVAGCGCWATGYGAGATGRRTAFALTIVPVLIAAVITVLADFSATRRGLIGISQESLVALQQSLSERQP